MTLAELDPEKPQSEWTNGDWLVELLRSSGEVDHKTAYTQAIAMLLHPSFFVNAAEDVGVFDQMGEDVEET